jgi:hypothetical protein
MVYCLLGKFDVAMPMIYGEGTKGFMRLQEEIMKNEDDHTIFAWGFGCVGGIGLSCFASSPANFAGCSDLQDQRSGGTHSSHIVMTNKGLNITMPVIRLFTGDYIGQLIATNNGAHLCLGIPLFKHSEDDDDVFYRPPPNTPEEVSREIFHGVSPKPIYIIRSAPKLIRHKLGIRLSTRFLEEIDVREAHPPNWDVSGGWYSMGLFDELLEKDDKMVLLGCRSRSSREHFVVRLDYKFRGLQNSLQVLYDRPALPLPVAAKVMASPLPLQSSTIIVPLLEVIASKGKNFDEMMQWEERVNLRGPDHRQPFWDQEIRDRYVWRLYLDQSESYEWKIDIAD